jgi:hypothetical protein
MRSQRLQFTIWTLMTVVAGSAVAFAPFAWLPQEFRGNLLIAILTVGSLALTLASPFLIDRLGRDQELRPRTGTVTSDESSSPLRRFLLRPDPPRGKDLGMSRVERGG